MSIALIKRRGRYWLYTTTSLVLLLIAGFALSVGMGEQGVQRLARLTDLPLTAFRFALYGVLLAGWPQIVHRLTPRRTLTPQRSPAKHVRRPLVLVIVLYEGLIVHNPLAQLFAWMV